MVCTVIVLNMKLDYCNSLYYKLHKSQLSRLQQIQKSLLVLSLKLLSPVIELPSCALSTGSGSLNALNTSFSLTYKVLTTTQPPYLYNLISVQRPRSTRSSSVVPLHALCYHHL